MVDSESRKLMIGRERKNKFRILLYGIVFTVLLLLLNFIKPTVTDFLHYRFYDLLLSENKGASSSVPVIVDIDERSLNEYGQFPWPRYRIAILLDKLRNLGASSIGLDMLFAEEDRASIHSIKKELSRDFGVDLKFGEVPESLRDNDQRLAEALSRGPIVLGYQFLFDEESDSKSCLLHPLQVNKLVHERTEEETPLFLHARSVSCNLEMFSQAAAGSGFFNISPDPDGILRRVPLIMGHQGKLYPSLALVTLMKAVGVDNVLLKTDSNGVDSIYLNQTGIPLTSKGSLLIRFRGKGKTFDYVSAADILSDRLSNEKIQGRIVFVGTSASGLKELRATPFDPVFPGVEVHATVVDNILKRDFIFRPKWAAGLESLGVLVLGLVSAFILAWAGAGWSSLLLGVIGVGVWQASASTFQNEGIFLSPVLPLIVLVCNFSILTFFRFWYEEQRVKERTRELAMVQEATIESMSSLTETRDPDTGEHIRRTKNYILLLAEH